MKQIGNKRLRSWLGGALAAIIAISPLTAYAEEGGAGAASASAASIYAYDTATKGAWNGTYGSDGYVLFGYDGREAEAIENQGDGKETALYDSDVAARPSYVDEQDGHMYSVDPNARAWVKLTDQSANTDVLAPPAGSGLTKTDAFISRGTPGDDGDIRQFKFVLNDNEEHLFTVYFAQDMNHKYYSVKDLDGKALVGTFRGMKTHTPPLPDAPGLPEGWNGLGSAAYITFKVKGSFVFEVMGPWSEGPAGMFFDPVPSDHPPADAAEAGLVATDNDTHGDWIGHYGADGHILFGYNYTGAVPGDNPAWGTWLLMKAAQYDYAVKPGYLNKFTYNINGDLWAKSSASDDASLTLPSDAASPAKHDTYGAGGGPGLFSFELNDNEWHQFTFYSNQVPNNDIQVTFQGNQGQTLIPKHAIPKNTFDGGAYVTYFVKGSFTMRLDKADSDMTFGPQAFFFDELADNALSDFSAAYEDPRSASLQWTNGNPSSNVLIERAEQPEGPFVQIGRAESGVHAYTDANLNAGTTYYYRLRIQEGTRYSMPSAGVASVTTPAYRQAELAFSSDAYRSPDAGAPIRLTATLEANGEPVAGKSIVFELSGPTVGDYIPANLGTAVTNQDGIAAFEFTPGYLGAFQVQASSGADDVLQIAAASAEASLTIGNPSWEHPPVVYKVSDAVKPGELISINGYGMKADDPDDIQVKLQAHTGVSGSLPSDSAVSLAIAQRDQRDGYFLMTEFSENLPAGLYDLWVGNEYGWSKPTVLNIARPLFISEYEAWTGQSIEISGRNMLAEQFGLQSSTKVRLTRPSGTIEQKLIRYTPYSLTFEVKAPQGVYGVEVSNDGGTAWNALSSGQTLTVVPKKQDPLQLGVAWAGDFNWDARFSVLSYGAVNDDDKDDTAAVIDAIEAAKTAGGGVVYFPAGDYYVGRIPMYADIVLLGENRDSTHLIYNSARANMFESEGDGAVNGHYGVSGFTVSLKDEAKRPDMFFAWGQPWSDAAGNMKLRTASEMFIHNVKLDYDLDSGFGQATPDPYAGMRGLGVVIIGQERFLVKDSDFSGWSAGITHAYLNEYTSYLGNDFRYSHEGYLQTVSNYSFAVGNTIHGPGWKRGMMKDNHGIFGRANVHMENNEVYDVGSDYNDGETYAVDSPAGNFNMGYVTNATADTLTTAPIAPYQDYAVMFNELAVQIVSGRGMGQLREVTGIEGNRLTIEGTWDVIPDGTSRFTLISPNDNVTIYNNYAENASKGIYIFGNSFDVVAANNHQKDTEGAFVWTALIQDAPAFVPAAHVAIRDNDFSGVSPKTQTGGILLNTQRYGSSGRYFSVGAYNIELRNNQLVGVPSAVPNNLSEAPYESGIVFWSGLKSSDLITDGYSGDATNLLVQNNKLSGFNRGISLTLGDYGILMADNTFNQVGEPVYNAGKDRVAGEAENVINLGGEASVDKGTLQQLYAAEIALNRSEASYEVPSWTAYSVALGSAEAVLNDGTATERTAQTALHALRSAIASLAPISVSPPGGGENPNTAPPRGNETAVPPSGGEDPDVTQPAAEKAWPAKGEAVHYNGPYLSGYSKDKIGPDNKLTRAEAVQLAYNLYERPTSQLKLGALSPYPDLDDAAWYAQAAAFSIQLELVRGYRDGTFRPDRDITRAEFLSLILHLRQLEPAATAAPFVDAQLHWAKPILDIAYSNGLIQGYPDGSFKPDSPITRAEAAALVNRLLQRGEEWTGTRAFADLPESHWAYDALMNAANGNNQ